MQIKRKHLFGTTILAGVMAASAPAFAQTTPAPAGQAATQVDEVVVTGSRIRRDPTTAPTPLIQVARAELLETGLSSVIDYLATIPALSNSLVPSDTTGSGLNDGGLSFANLRTLGTGRTLTLVDGRRHVGSSAGSLSVDVDTIPRLLIENIEIVTGGASSVYGADAVAGVLNFKLRHDYEGAEIDANYAIINQDGNQQGRISALIGHNFLDDRLNLYAFAEYEDTDEVKSLDIDWLRRDNVILGIDADPTAAINGPNNDGRLDTLLFQNGVRLDRPRWGSTTLANAQQPSPLNNPNVPLANCGVTSGSINSSSCYSVDPAKTYWYDGTTARLANFGQRLGNTGANRPWNIGGDGENGAEFSTGSRVPHSESARYQAGATFDIFSNVTAYAEAKYVKERTSDTAQPTFFDIFLSDDPSFTAANTNNYIIGTGSFIMRYSDNAFLPANVKAAIASNMVTNYGAPTLTSPGAALTPVLSQKADHRMFGPDRIQNNERDLQRYVLAFNGDIGDVGFVHGLNWDLSGTYGKMENTNQEIGVDVERFNFAADSVVDTAGVLGTPGAIVCRVKLLKAQNVPNGNLYDYVRSGTTFNGVARGNIDVRDTAAGNAAIDACQPLNVFGKGNQSQAGLDYVAADIHVREENTQTDVIGSVSGQLWDFFGAGPMGLALGAEYRKETTKGIGRSAETGDRFLFLNTGPDFPEASYESNEAFAELSLPLLKDSWLGEYAELSGSYRYADYSTVGKTEVYGANLVYRPIHDIAFKTSYNTSIRVPSLGENFSPYTQTFSNGFVDPCATASIVAILDATIKTNRINNCTTLAAAKGLTYDFGGTTGTTFDDYVPAYLSGVAGVNGGNPFLKPETSNSFTFSTVIQPRFIPNFSLVLDYYEIQIDDVIQSVTAPVVAANCVNGPTLNAAACSTIFRNVAPFAGVPTTNIERSEAFKVGAPNGDPIGGFIQGSINYAKRTVRGLDFTTRYSFDTEEMLGHNWGVFTHSLQGSWLIEQKNFTDIANPNTFTDLSGGVFYPRVRFTSRLTWAPVDSVRVTWTTDWQSSQTITRLSGFVTNADTSPFEYTTTGNFMRNDLTVRWDLTDDVTLRAGITNIFDAEQAPWLGTGLDSNFDPYGRRYNIGLNYKFQ